MTSEKLIRKGIVYGANYGSRLIANLTKFKDLSPKVGHPFAALGLGAWDMLYESSGSFKNNKYIKGANIAIKAGSTAYFGALAVNDLVQFAKGNFDNWYNFPFNASMAYTSVKDLSDSLIKSGK